MAEHVPVLPEERPKSGRSTGSCCHNHTHFCWLVLNLCDLSQTKIVPLHKIELSQVNIILRGTTTARLSNALQQSPSTESKPQKSPSQKVINFFSSILYRNSKSGRLKRDKKAERGMSREEVKEAEEQVSHPLNTFVVCRL